MDAHPVFIRVNNNVPCYAYTGRTREELEELYNNYVGEHTGRALLTGKISNIFAIDIDDLRTYGELIRKHSIYDLTEYTYTERTARGIHCYFIMPEQLGHLTVGTNKPFTHWDYRNNGGYCVYAGSRYTKAICCKFGRVPHRCGDLSGNGCNFDGLMYTPMNDQPIAEMPENLINLFMLGGDVSRHGVGATLQLGYKPQEYRSEFCPIELPPVKRREIILAHLNRIDFAKVLDCRDNWIKFMFFCKQNGLTAEDFHMYSSKAEAHSPCSCFIKWNEGYTPTSVISINWLRRLSSPVPVNRFDYDDVYTYFDLRREFSGKIYHSYAELEDALYDKCRATMVYSVEQQVVITKTVNGIQTYKSIGNSGFVLQYADCNNRLKKIDITTYILSRPEFSYAYIDCVIDESKLSNRVFNTWAGYQARLTADIDEDVINAINKFILEVWADGDRDIYHYIISWFANIVQNVSINRVALVCISKPGCGKNTLVDFFKYIIGIHSVCETTGIAAITQKHNTVIENKRLVVINEMSSTRDEFRSSFDKLKAYITDARLFVEPKGLKPYEINNIGNYILMTNHADSVIIESDDRRYQVLELSDIYMNDKDYFDHLRKTYFNQACANSYYTYLMQYDIGNIHDIIVTERQIEMKQLSKPTSIRFIEEYKLEHEQDIANNIEYCISATELYYQFVEWCRVNGEKVVSQTKFGTQMSSALIRDRNKSYRYYTFP